MTDRSVEIKGFSISGLVDYPANIHVNDIQYRRAGTPTAFRWTPAMSAIWPKDYRPTMTGLLALWEAMHEAAEYSVIGASEERPAYPEGDVVGACVCGSWPGGECLRCEWKHAASDDGWIKFHAKEVLSLPSYTKIQVRYQFSQNYFCFSVRDIAASHSSITHWRLAK